MGRAAPLPLTVGTAGHIDHGKTVLIEALTGVDTDRLPEERLRGISIELGFAQLELASGRRLSVVDVPGHERFVRTMVAGATGIDLFLLAVAADDGVMPQTREHLTIIEMLGVPAGVVALTKIDLVDADGVQLAREEVEALLASTPYEGSPIVPVCAPSRQNLDDLVHALDQVASAVAPRADKGGAPRLHVDRSFTLKGIGTVVTGTLWSGALQAGDEVRLEPSAKTARIRSVEVHGDPVQVARAGQRVALNIGGVDRREVQRGDVVTRGSKIDPTYLIDGAIELLPGAEPVRGGTRVQVHHGTRMSAGRVAPLEADVVQPGIRSYAQIRLEAPLIAAAGDRFVLRKVAPPDTIGGGVVIDARPRKHGAGMEHVERLRLLETGNPLERLSAQLAASPSGVAEDESDVGLLERLQASGSAIRVGEDGRYFAPSQLERARKLLLAALSEAGTAQPLSRGALADRAGISTPAARALLEDLRAEGEVTQRGSGYLPAAAMADHNPLEAQLVRLLHGDLLEPRNIDALARALGATAAETRELAERALLEGRLERLKPGLYYHSESLHEAERRIVDLCDRDGSVTIASLRDELGTSRKYAQALLEHFDSKRLTRRQGDEHVLRRPTNAIRPRVE